MRRAIVLLGFVLYSPSPATTKLVPVEVSISGGNLEREVRVAPREMLRRISSESRSFRAGVFAYADRPADTAGPSYDLRL